MGRLIAFDTETRLIEPGILTPRLICLSLAEGDKIGLFDKSMGVVVMHHLLLDPSVTFVGHNVVYDWGVLAAERQDLMPLIFKAYAEGRVFDTKIRQEMKDIAAGRVSEGAGTFVIRNGEMKKASYSLAGLSEEYLGKNRYAEKNDDTAWRTRYAELEDLPVHEWPEAAQKDAREDAADTLAIFERQGGIEGALPTEGDQLRAAWALHLMSVWGIRTAPEKVAPLEEMLLKEQDRLRKRLKQAQFIVAKRCPESEKEFDEVIVKRRKAMKKDMQPSLDGVQPEIVTAAGVSYVVTRSTSPAKWGKNLTRVAEYVERVCKRRGLPVPLTESGKTSTSKQTLIDTGSALLATFADGGGIDKVLQTYVPALKQGAERPINARFNVLVNTARTSCSEPNLQNLPSGRRIGGVRECFVPRPGYVYCSVDYDTLELRALAQVCLRLFKHSKMAEVINSGRDLHSSVGADMVGVTYEEVEKGKKVKGSRMAKARDAAKVANFGLPGGLGAKSLVDYARTGYGVILTEQQAREMKSQWLGAWPEMVQYFDWINTVVGMGEAQLKHPITGFLRGNVGYTDGCNHLFQHLAAMGAKRAMFRVAHECYVDHDTALYGTRPVAFIHDEIFAEMPEEVAHEAAQRMAKVMCEEMATLIPDVKIGASPTLMRYWSKKAEDLFDENGRMIPWPKETT
jgi:hypothetical protein